jgi:hypothetical protein
VGTIEDELRAEGSPEAVLDHEAAVDLAAI